jgi:hypothetical protein
MQGQVNNQIWNGKSTEGSAPPAETFRILTEDGNNLAAEDGSLLNIEH